MQFLILAVCLVVLTSAGCVATKAGSSFVPPAAVGAQQAVTPVKSASPREGAKPKTAAPVSLLEQNTMLTIYGRAFGVAPILGRLGTYKNFDMMAEDVRPWVNSIKRDADTKGVIMGVHLIYALAIPCEPRGNCLLYLEAIDKEIIKNYIDPAAERGWAVILDSQLGKSTPVEQVRRMINRGYLKYDNVHVAIDPEFHARNETTRPGIPIGTVDASEINDAQSVLDEYVKAQGLPSKKILIVHQFGDANVNDGVPFMIENKKELKTFDNVDLVINADGFGKQPIKVFKYNKITDSSVYPFIKYRGIKIFYPNKWEKTGHFDEPPLTIPQVFGKQKIRGKLKLQSKPNVVIIA